MVLVPGADSKVEFAKKAVSVACLAIGLGGIAFVGVSAVFRGGEQEIYMPWLSVPAKELESERVYVEDVFASFGGANTQFLDALNGVDIVVDSSFGTEVMVGESVDDTVMVAGAEVSRDTLSVVERPKSSVAMAPVVAGVVERESKPMQDVAARGTVTKQAGRKPVDVDDVAAAREALRNGDYARVVSLLKYVPKSREVLYLRAYAIMEQFKVGAGAVSGQDVIAAWSQVKSYSVVGSEQYNEADSILWLFR